MWKENICVRVKSVESGQGLEGPQLAISLLMRVSKEGRKERESVGLSKETTIAPDNIF